MIPTTRLIRLAVTWLVLGVCASVWSHFSILWFTFAGLALFAALDFYFLRRGQPLEVERHVPMRLALGVPVEIELKISNPNSREIAVDCFDGIPESIETNQLPWRGSITGKGFTRLIYVATPLQRGEVEFSKCHFRVDSPFGLWQRRYKLGKHTSVKVYPNFEPVIRYTLLATASRESQMGIFSRNRVGQSREFHQLREYQDGDVLSQIDWKATARRNQLVSREYREQRNQTLILMVDSGRRMRALDGQLPQFEHCLNSMLLLSYIALRQGDQVGIMSYGGTQRFLPPVKGQHSMNVILNHLYNYETTPSPGDFSEAVENLMSRQRRRAMVVVLTNLRSEDSAHLLPPLRLMRRRHLVLVASLREKQVIDQLKQPIIGFSDALLNAAGHAYLEERATFLATLRDHGVLTLDETAELLPAALANSYLDIKKQGLL